MKTLSKNNATLKMPLPILITLFSCVILYSILANYSTIKYLVVLSVLVLGILWMVKKYKGTYDLFYDHEYLILKNTDIERKIPLKNIQSITLTSGKMRIMGFSFYEHTISFKNEADYNEAINFYVFSLNESFWDFQDLVKRLSPKVYIENDTSA